LAFTGIWARFHLKGLFSRVFSKAGLVDTLVLGIYRGFPVLGLKGYWIPLAKKIFLIGFPGIGREKIGFPGKGFSR